MRRLHFAPLFACLLALGVALSGCTQDDGVASAPNTGVPLQGDFTGSGREAGALTSANTLSTVDRRLTAVTSLAARIQYTSTSGITGGHTQVTGSVFVPRREVPEGGWPIVVLGHGTTGVDPDCAPSLSRGLFGSASTVEAIVKAGYMVVLPDYQGLGLDETYHPYLEATTAGYNMIDSVRASRRLVPQASDRWVAIGISQGGQAAWAANELAGWYGSGLRLVGAVALSAPLDITGFADAAATGTLTREQQPVLQLLLASWKNENPALNLDDYRRGIVAEKWAVLSACEGPELEERSRVATQITADDLRPATPEAVEALRAFLARRSLPQAPTVAPMLVIYGGQDSLIPPAWTDRALLAACGMGDVIEIRMEAEEAHATIDVSTVFRWVTERFIDVPAPNSCGSLQAAVAEAGGGQ